MHSVRSSVLLRALLAAALLIPLGLFARAGATPASPGTAQASNAAAAPAASAAASPDDVDRRRTELDLDLVSRTYDTGDDNWTIVTEATLSSNRICLPLVFNCIVGEVDAPANASLDELTCDSLGWNHLLVFRNHCMKQLLFAGHEQKFTFTWTTDPGVNSGTVDLEVEFGRGFLPAVFQQLATAKLTVDLDVALDISKSCPTEVDAGDTLTCTVEVAYPTPPEDGPDISGITVGDTPDAELADLLTTGGALSPSAGSGTWDCIGLVCSDGELSSGESATFDFTATVADDPVGGDGVNEASVKWSAPSEGGPLTADDGVVVIGTGDTLLEIDKTTSDTEANPGGPITWTVEVTNVGPLDATDVVISDVAPPEVDGLTLTYTEGVGDWTCDATSCSSASMPLGAASFTAAGTVSPDAKGDNSVVNEVGVTWANDILGPDFPITAGSAVPVVASATTTTTPGPTPTPTTTTPSPSPSPTNAPGRGGSPLSIAG